MFIPWSYETTTVMEFGCILASICRKTLYITYIYMHIRYYNTLKPKKLQT